MALEDYLCGKKIFLDTPVSRFDGNYLEFSKALLVLKSRFLSCAEFFGLYRVKN